MEAWWVQQARLQLGSGQAARLQPRPSTYLWYSRLSMRAPTWPLIDDSFVGHRLQDPMQCLTTQPASHIWMDRCSRRRFQVCSMASYPGHVCATSLLSCLHDATSGKLGPAQSHASYKPRLSIVDW